MDLSVELETLPRQSGQHSECRRHHCDHYTIDDGRENSDAYRLFITMLVPAEVSASERAGAYAQRWEALTAPEAVLVTAPVSGGGHAAMVRGDDGALVALRDLPRWRRATTSCGWWRGMWRRWQESSMLATAWPLPKWTTRPPMQRWQ